MIVIDMELPKTCRSCNLSFDAYGSITEGKCAALRFGVTYMNDRRNPICPIVGEIPDKHGRLIDEAKLRERAYAIQRRDRISFTDALAMALIEAETIVEATE